MKKNENKTSKFVCIVLLLCVIAMILVAGTYAKYTSSATGTDSATVAKWDIKVNDTQLGVENATVTFDLFAGEDTLIAPGSTGSADLKIVNGSDVDATYEISFAKTGATVPLQYSLDNKTWEDSISAVDATEIAAGTDDTVTVYWKWVTESDTADTTLGVAAASATQTVTVDATITVSQAD